MSPEPLLDGNGHGIPVGLFRGLGRDFSLQAGVAPVLWADK